MAKGENVKQPEMTYLPARMTPSAIRGRRSLKAGDCGRVETSGGDIVIR